MFLGRVTPIKTLNPNQAVVSAEKGTARSVRNFQSIGPARSRRYGTNSIPILQNFETAVSEIATVGYLRFDGEL
jgi:hypothetical protein